MAFSPFDSAIFRKLYGDAEVSALFSDSAEVRAMLLVEGMLAKVQGELGVIPLASALLIQRSTMEVQIDPAGLADGMGRDGVVVPALVAAFRKAMEAPEHAQYVHWGATSQDIIDTALILRLRQFIAILDTRIGTLVAGLNTIAVQHGSTVMAARTRSQMATPTTFGAKVSGWISPLKRHQERLSELKKRLLVVSLAGAAGNYAALGDNGFEIEKMLADALKLQAPNMPWHSARDNIVELASVLSLITGSLGKIGQDIIHLSQSEVGEVEFSGGGSSTMPHKSNPVLAEVLVTMARHNANSVSEMHQALVHSQERDGVAWALEWLALPQMCISTGVALKQAQSLMDTLDGKPEKMLKNINAAKGNLLAEAATFALAKHMPRPDAQELVKICAITAAIEGRELRDVLMENTSIKIDWDTVFDPTKNTGLAKELANKY